MGHFDPFASPEVLAWFSSPLFERCKTHEVFTHVDHMTGKVRHFDATMLYEDLKAGKVAHYVDRYHFRGVDLKHIYKNQGVEQWKVDRLTYHICRRPILVCRVPDWDGQRECDVIIDGNHRIIRRALHGLRWAMAFVIDPPHWEPYLLPIPEALNHIYMEITHDGQIDPEASRRYAKEGKGPPPPPEPALQPIYL
ncbi:MULTISPECIES: hypothetical protein [unclassified Bradyrhizobium]|uniref:hypothetical protein n=1 Tax=unclassified Bradyrhizobium TaxID=2631580 RepID=UPI003399D319